MRHPIRRRNTRAASAVSKPLRYYVLSGAIADLVAVGKLIRTGTLLERLGADDLPDGQQSWYGRHVVKAWRAAHGGASPVRVWAPHRTTGKYVHVYVYAPVDPALYVGLASYKATRHLVAADFTEAA